METIWPLVTLGFVAVVALIVSGLALAIAYMGSPTKLLNEFGELNGAVARIRQTANAAEAAVFSLREEMVGHRAASAQTLAETVDAMERAEVKRRGARKERGRAEEARDQVATEQQGGVCPVCQNHDARVSCMDAARQRFRAEGHSV